VIDKTMKNWRKLEEGDVIFVKGGPITKRGIHMGERGKYRVISTIKEGINARKLSGRLIGPRVFIYMGSEREGPSGITIMKPHEIIFLNKLKKK